MYNINERQKRLAEFEGWEFREFSPDWSKWFCLNYGDGQGWYKRPNSNGWGCLACEEGPPNYDNDANAAAWLLEKFCNERKYVANIEYWRNCPDNPWGCRVKKELLGGGLDLSLAAQLEKTLALAIAKAVDAALVAEGHG